MTAIIAWFTGLSGAGKSTIAGRVAERLGARGRRVLILDGDVVRTQLHRHLGFSPEDIRENNRLIAGLCQHSAADYDVILVPIVSPFCDARAAARAQVGVAFAEVYVRASLAEVERRDPKGLYRKVREGSLTGFIGIAPEVPYEPPVAPEVVLDTEGVGPEASASALADYLEQRLAEG